MRTCYPSRVSYADHPPCHPGLLGPTRLAGLRKQQGRRRAPRRDGQEVDRSRSGDQCRRSRSRPIQFGRNGISSSSRNGPQCGSATVQPISRSQPRANADVVGGAFLSSASLAPSATIQVAPRRGFARAGLGSGCLETTQARARASTRLWSSGTDRGQLGRQQWKQSAPRVRRRKGQGSGEREAERMEEQGRRLSAINHKVPVSTTEPHVDLSAPVAGMPAALAVLLTGARSRIPCIGMT